jgi:UDP-glucose 4-epimerase
MEGVDYVFHLAAMISVPESMFKPIECVDINVRGLLNVLEEAAAAKVKKLCFSTSAAIYGDNPVVPKREEMLPEPKSPYAITKLDGEYYCSMFSREGKLPTACLRYFNVFGPRQDPKSAYAAAVPIFTAKAVANEKITVFGDGEQTRDFIYVKDIVAANVFMAQNDFTGVYNVAYGKKITINDLVQNIKTITASNSEVEHLPERAGDVKHSMAAVDKLFATGFRPQNNFEQGLAATIAYFQHRPDKTKN